MSQTPQPVGGVGVEIRGLRKSFSGQSVLKGIDLSIKPGEILVVMGASGSGKTVLLKHIIGLEEPDAGEILIAGDPISCANVFEKYRFGMVFQSGALLNSMTVAENVGLYLAEHHLGTPAEIARRVKETLALVDLHNIEGKYPAELSGGMKKRVAIARALIIEPQIMLYDEPTSELDPLSAVTISEEILSLNRRTHVTSIVVTHDRDLAFGVADRIAIIDRGEVLLVGTPEEIRQSTNEVVKNFINADFRKDRK